MKKSLNEIEQHEPLEKIQDLNLNKGNYNLESFNNKLTNNDSDLRIVVQSSRSELSDDDSDLPIVVRKGV